MGEGCNSKRYGAFAKLELKGEEEEEGRLCFSVDEDLWDQDYEILG